ncbi:MAG: GntR family transcriptional regulator [Polaromonas sp.]|nr:GntR family transcriptional regulator [Polaromonas sp.]
MQVKNKTAPLKTSPADESLPLYRQVKRELQKIIEDGHYGPGKPLPSEATLALALQVSIGTLRHAVDELVHEHVLVRRQGKGTFVAPHNRARFMFQFFHVEPRWDPEDDTPQEQEFPEITCMAFARDNADALEARALRIKPGEAVFRIENKLALRGRPVVHDRLALSAMMFRNLTEKRFIERPGTVYALYQTDFGITVLRAQERARAVPASKAVARALALPVGTPVMEVHRLALTFGDKPVEYRISSINTQAHDYVSMLSKAS